MKNVEKEHLKEELEKQQKQWVTEPLPQFGGRDIRIDPRKQEGTKTQTVLVAPPSTGTVSTSISSSPQEHETTSDQKLAPTIQTKQGGFFTTTGKSPPPSRQIDSITQKPPSSVDNPKSTFFTPAATPAKTHQKNDADNFRYRDTSSPTEEPLLPSRHIDSTTQKPSSNVHSTKSTFFTPSSAPITAKTEKPSYKDASSPSKTRQRSPKEVPDKTHLSDSFNASNQNNEPGSLAKPSAKQANISGANQTSGVIVSDKPSPGSTKARHKTGEPDISPLQAGAKENTKGVRSDDEKFKTEKLRRMLTESEATELQSQLADSQEPEIPKKPSDTLSKKAADVDQNRATSPAQEELSVAQNAQRQAKAPPADPEVSDLSPSQVESKEAAKGNISDERFKTARLRKMFYESEAAQLQSQPVDSQAPTKQKAPAIPKKPSDLQDVAKQGTMIPDNEKIIGSPSTGRRAASTPTNADKAITVSPPKGGMAQHDRATAGPDRSPSISEKKPIPPVPRKSETAGAWSAPTSSKPIPPIQQAPPTAPSTDKLDKAAGVDKRAPQGAPQQTPTDARNDSGPVQGTDPSTHVTIDEKSDKSSTMGERAPEVSLIKTPLSDSRTTSAPIQEAIRDARGKQAPGARGEIPDAGYSGDSDTAKKSVDKTTAEPISSPQ
uniref:Uncharacterized protein n=1 Tax=Arundo donax TaxID=35708 RepID=A0A0A9DE79_ARUDO